jgi:FkbM family methyltransferase
VTSLPATLRRWAQPLRRRWRPTVVERRIAALELRHGDVAIDCGANVGDVTGLLARRGAFVHAFEPNPSAFGVLAHRFGDDPNVRLYPQAVLDRPGTTRLYLHVDAVHDPVGASSGSSVLAGKGNVDTDSYVDVEAIDLAHFVLALARPVRVLKLDVEGAECPIVHRLLDTGAIDRVQTVLVELHDRHIPALRPENERLRERLAREGLAEKVLTDWV